MDNIFFWQHRHRDTKFPYLFLLGLAVIAFCLGLYYYFTGENAMIRWEKVPQIQTLDAFIDQFKVGGQDFSIKANGYLLTERYDASLPFINLPAAKIYLALLAFCLVFYLATVSGLKRIPYFVGMTLLMFFLVSCNLDGLGLISDTGTYALFAALFLFTLPSYAFQAFFPNVTFSQRLVFFVLLVALTGGLIYYASVFPPEATTLHILNHAVIGCAVAAAMFILWVSYELIHAIVWFNTRAKTQAGRFGLWQFMLIALLYLANLLLFFFEEAGIFRLGFGYLDAFITLFLSALAGFWGLQKREESYGRVLSFWPGAAFLYLVFATVTFVSIGYAFAAANDSLIAAFKTVIIYSHLAYGFMFFLYVMINYGRLIIQKLPIYRIIYDPKKLPFYTVYIMGSILFAILIFRKSANTYNQVQAAYYNYLGDLYKFTGQEILAERYYQESDVYEHNNVKANYSLAGISREKHYRNREIIFLKQALLLRPDPKVFARLSAAFDEQPYFFEQQYTLKRALNKFPESPEILNNMALLYNKTAILDSVAYYYDLAENFSEEKVVIQNNKLAMLIKNALPQQADILAKATAGSGYIPLKSNIVLLQHLTGRETPKPVLPPGNHTFNASEFTLLYHSLLNRLHTGDTSALKNLAAYAKNPANSLYEEDFNLLKAAHYHYNGRPQEGKSSLEFLSRNTASGTGYYQDIIGLWLMEKKLFQAASVYFAEARKNGFTEAPLHESWALALAGKHEAAQTALQVATAMENPDLRKPAIDLQHLLQATPAQALAFEKPAGKIQYIAIHAAANPTGFPELLNSVKDPALKTDAEQILVARLLNKQQYEAAQSLLTTGTGNNKNKSPQQAERNRLQCLLWLKTNNITALKANLNKLHFDRENQAEKMLYQAVIAASETRRPEAKKLFSQVIIQLPYHEEAMLAAAAFYRDQLKDDAKAYNILLAGVNYNPYSATLYRAYALQSLKTGLEEYARAAAEKLEALISPEEYRTFNQQFQARLTDHQKLAEGWE